MGKLINRLLGRTSASDAARILNEKKQNNRSALIARTNQLCDELGRKRVF